MKFKLTWHLVLQILMGVVQVGNLLMPQVSGHYQAVVAGVVAVAQALLHVYAHNQQPPQ